MSPVKSRARPGTESDKHRREPENPSRSRNAQSRKPRTQTSDIAAPGTVPQRAARESSHPDQPFPHTGNRPAPVRAPIAQAESPAPSVGQYHEPALHFHSGTESGPESGLTLGAAADSRPAPVNPGSSATISAQLWLQEAPWRLTAGWSVLAALLAYGWLSRSFFIDWRLVALALLLADPLWGSIWRLAGGRAALLPLRQQRQDQPMWLPYLRPGSPAAQLLGWDSDQTGDPVWDARRASLPLIFRVAVPTLSLSLAVGWVLGVQALWLTIAVIVISIGGWIGRQFLPFSPAILQSLVTVTLPWTLMLGLLNLSRSHELFGLHVALIALWTLHHWGQGRIIATSPRSSAITGPIGALQNADRLGLGLLATADLGMGALLIYAQTPLWLAPLAILWLPTYLTLYQGKRIQRPAIWWLAAMLLSSAAIGSRML